LEQLQTDLDHWLEDYNSDRPHSGKYCFGKTPMQTFLDSRQLAWDQILDREAVRPLLVDLVCQIKSWLLHLMGRPLPRGRIIAVLVKLFPSSLKQFGRFFEEALS